MDNSLPLLLFLAGVMGILALLLAALFSHYKKGGLLARSLNMSLFLIRLPKEIPKEGDLKKQDKELIGVMEQLFSSFGTMRSSGFKKFIYGEPHLALELAVHHIGEEIHYYLGVPKTYELVLEKQILGFYPTAEVIKTKDYNIFNPSGSSLGSYFTFITNPIVPFRTYQKLEADPMGEILTALSKLQEEGEGAAIQILLKPSRRTGLKKFASKVSKEMQKGADFPEALGKSRKTETLSFFGEAISEIFSSSSAEEKEKQKVRQEERKVLTPYHEELVKSIVGKASKATFDANIRILTSAASDIRAAQILQEIESAFVQFSAPDLNSLKPRRVAGNALKRLIFDFSFRLFNERSVIYLSTEELASLYHFPLPTTAASRLHVVKAKTAEPPPELPKEGIILGKNIYRGEERTAKMLPDDRRRHLYLIGQTGTGKTNLMKNLIVQDIAAGEGVAVIDPHGDLIDDILGLVPQERVEDVIVFNPGDTARPLGLNILEIDPDQPQQKSFVMDDFYKILRTIYKDLPEAFGPIFEKFFKNTIMLLLDDYRNEIPTIAEISRIFADKDYRDAKLDREENPEIIRFWKYEAEKMTGEWSLPNMSGYITSKFAPFLINEYVRPIITQQRSAFNFRDVMDNKKILLVNLSKGLIGELNASLLGMVVVSKLLVAAFSRVDVAQEERKDFYLYIDEFQNFTTDSISVILSEARKYRLNLTIAHQFIKQLQEPIRDAVFGNVGSMLAFRVGADDAEYLKNKFEPVFSPQDLMNIDNFNAYVKLLIQNQTSRPFNLRILPAPKGNPEISQTIRELSRMRFGRDREEVEKEFRERQGIAV